MIPKLQPCPFCGGTKQKIDIKQTFPHSQMKYCSVTVRCMKCHARGPVVGINMPRGQHNEQEICANAAVETWNWRAEDVQT